VYAVLIVRWLWGGFHQWPYTVPVSPRFQPSLHCDVCGAIARELHEAWQADNRDVAERMREVASSSGRDVQKFVVDWVCSITDMPDDEMQTLLRSHYPRVAEARRRKAEHENSTGHSVTWHSYWRFGAQGVFEHLR
jgi:hypothetical protein